MAEKSSLSERLAAIKRVGVQTYFIERLGENCEEGMLGEPRLTVTQCGVNARPSKTSKDLANYQQTFAHTIGDPMGDISIQFHATQSELRDFAKQCVSDFRLQAVAVKYFPYEAVRVESCVLNDVFTDMSTVQELVFSLNNPKIPAKDSLELWDNNPEILRLQIGRRKGHGIEESHLSSRAVNASVYAIWKQVAKRLKSITHQGAIAVNPKTGASGLAKSHRFTNGALSLESDGIAMLTITGIVLKPKR